MKETKQVVENLKNELGKCDFSLFGMLKEYILHYHLADFNEYVKPEDLKTKKDTLQQRAYGTQGCIWSMLYQHTKHVDVFCYYFNQSFSCDLEEVMKNIEDMRYVLARYFSVNSPVFTDYTK